MDLQQVEREVKDLIVEALMLDDVKAEDIVSTEPLFVEGLGLDSIDALELAMAIDQRWGVAFADDPEQNQRLFASVRALAEHILAHARGQ